MLENSERSVRGVRMGKSGPLERSELTNQIQGFRIPDRWDASEKKVFILYCFIQILKIFLQKFFRWKVELDEQNFFFDIMGT